MSTRTVQVVLVDGSMVTVEEPDWCTSDHEDGLDLEDLLHNGPEITMTVPTRFGDVDALDAGLCQNPFASRPQDRMPAVTVLLGGSYQRFDPDGVRDLAARLVVYAGRLRDLGAQLAAVLAEGAGR